MPYSTKDELWNLEGLPKPTDGGPSVEQLDEALEYVSRLIDEWTGWWFEPRSRTYLLDGPGDMDTLFFEAPIIAITSVHRVEPDGTEAYLYEDTELVIYNRHLVGQLDPDDRRNARIELNQEGTYPAGTFDSDRRFYQGQLVWPYGQHNIKVVGKFGYTDYDEGVTEDGITPRGVARLCRLLVLRYGWPKYSHQDEVESADRGRITDEKTRDQSWKRAYPWADGKLLSETGVGAWTGDPEIDRLIMSYSSPMDLGAV